jgi:hypothetical protein
MPFSCKHSLFFWASQKNRAGFLGRILPSPYSPTMPRAKLRQRLKTAKKTVAPIVQARSVKTLNIGGKAEASRNARPA